MAPYPNRFLSMLLLVTASNVRKETQLFILFYFFTFCRPCISVYLSGIITPIGVMIPEAV